MNGKDFIGKITSKAGVKREVEVMLAIGDNHLPSFMQVKNFAEVVVTKNGNTIKYFVAKEYFSVGTDDDYLVTPCTPVTLQSLLKSLQCSLPTPTMVEQIYSAAAFKLPARPQRPSPGESITSSRLFVSIDEAIKKERDKKGASLNDLVAGHKKDVVLTNTLLKKENKGNVAIYGWYYSDGQKIQGLNPKDHTVNYVDYSHGLRLVSNKCILNGVETTLQEVWSSPVYSKLIHDEPLGFQSY